MMRENGDPPEYDQLRGQGGIAKCAVRNSC